MPKLSLIIIARNEEYRLSLLLPLMRSKFDEIIVVSQESTDCTEETALKYADKVVNDTATGFAESSVKLAISLASNDIIVRLDADELITHRLYEAALLMEDHIDGLLCSRAHITTKQICEARLCECMNYGEGLEGVHHLSEPMQYRVFRKSAVEVIETMHGGMWPKHMSTVRYLYFNGIIHIKTPMESVTDIIRYEAIKNDIYDSNVHF